MKDDFVQKGISFELTKAMNSTASITLVDPDGIKVKLIPQPIPNLNESTTDIA